MKIGQPPPSNDGVQINRTGNEAAKPAAKTPPLGNTSDVQNNATNSTTQVQLSNAAAALRAQASTPEFDGPKVAKVKQAIDDGSYKINADTIADKLIANAKEVLNAVKR